MAIMDVKALRPEFKAYVVDGIDHTAEQLAFNPMNDAPSFGPVDKWRKFIDGGCEWGAGHAPAAAAPPPPQLHPQKQRHQQKHHHRQQPQYQGYRQMIQFW
jgi:hypothetical protein